MAGMHLTTSGNANKNGNAKTQTQARPDRATRGERPNILIHIADDLSWKHLGCEGNPNLNTPNIDRVAEAGVRFTHAFVSSTTCTPSRNALLTGRNFWELESGANLRGSMPQKFRVYTETLAEAGYHVGRIEKGYGPGRADGWEAWGHDPAGPSYLDLGALIRDKSDDQPFVAWHGSKEPHRPYPPNSGQRAGIEVGEGEVLPYWPDVAEVRDDYADYLAAVERFDAQLGEMIEVLKATGQYENTVILVLSDHGMPFPRCKASLYDYGTRCPLIMCGPGVHGEGRVLHDLISYIDIAPTLLELAGLEPDASMGGRSFKPLLETDRGGTLDPSREAVYFGTEVFGWDRLWPTRGVRTRKHLYIRNFEPGQWRVLDTLQGGQTKDYLDQYRDQPEVDRLAELCFGRRPPEELYDIEADPYQLDNLAADAAYAPIRTSLAERLKQRMRQTDDPRVAGQQPGAMRVG